MRFLRSKPFLAVYEGADDAAAAAAKAAADAAAAEAAAKAAGGGNDDSVKDQAQLNAVLKKEKEKFRADREKLIKQLEDIQKSAQTSDTVRTQLETQLEELRQANMSTEERARLQKEKLEKDYSVKLDAASKERDTWQERHNSLQVGYEITTSAAAQKVVPSGVTFVESFLRPKTRLVEVLGEDNKGTGEFRAMVKFPDRDKEGKSTTVDYTVADAVKRMKELPDDFGFLFESAAAGGLGAGTGTGPGKKPNVKNMTPAQYMEARQKNPASVGLA